MRAAVAIRLVFLALCLCAAQAKAQTPTPTCGMIPLSTNPNPQSHQWLAPSVIMNGVTCDMWYMDATGCANGNAGGLCPTPLPGHSPWRYSSASDSTCSAWNAPVELRNADTNGPTPFLYFTVVQDPANPAHYYGMGADFYGVANPQTQVYLWDSTDKVNWHRLNDGVPVLSATGIEPFNRLFNQAFAIVGNTWYLLTDGAYTAPGCSGGTGTQFVDGYAWATTTDGIHINFQPHFFSSSPVLPRGALSHIYGGGAPVLHYIPDRNALLVMYGDGYQHPCTPNDCDCGAWQIAAGWADLAAGADALGSPSAWHTSPWFSLSTGFIDADIDFQWAPVGTKGFDILMTWNVDQNQGYAARYGGGSIDTFFDALQCGQVTPTATLTPGGPTLTPTPTPTSATTPTPCPTCPVFSCPNGSASFVGGVCSCS